MSEALRRILEPQSIAVVGASSDPTKRGHQILRALEGSGFGGEVLAVNPKGGEILGRQVVGSVDDLPSGVDLAVLCTPAATAPELVRACGRRGVGGALVLAVGFGESGEEGRALERELRRAAAESGVRVVGPNTSGVLNLGTGLNLVGARGVRAGGLGLLVQSGNVALALMTEVTERSWEGISIYLGVGNQIDVGFAEALDFLASHPETRAVITYLEGVTRSRDFLRVAARATRSKPVVAIKSGRTESGAAAALSHTGSVAGPYDRFSAALEQAGVVELLRTDELLHVAETLGNQPPCAPGRGIAVLADGGGQGTLAADTLAEADARLATLAPTTRDALRELLGRAAATTNPVDLAGAADADPTVFADALELLLADHGVGCVLVVGLFGGYGVRFSDTLTEAETEAGRTMAERATAAEKGLVVHSMYAAHRTAPLAALGAARVPVVGSLEVACRCVVELQRRGEMLLRPVWALVDDLEGPSAQGGRRSGALSAGDGAGPSRAEPARIALSEPDARALLAEHGLEFAPFSVVSSAEEAAAAVQEIGRPAALKLVSASIVHKSDAGGVRLDVATPEEAIRGFDAIVASAEAWLEGRGLPSESIRVMVSAMAAAPRVELLVGGYRDEQLGPVVTLGAGGVWVEAMADVAHRVLPVRDEEVAGALARLRIAGLLAEGRGRRAVETAPIVRAARAVASLLEGDERVAEVELNPLFVYEDRVEPVDARVILAG